MTEAEKVLEGLGRTALHLKILYDDAMSGVDKRGSPEALSYRQKEVDAAIALIHAQKATIAERDAEIERLKAQRERQADMIREWDPLYR